MSAATKTIYCKMAQSWWKADGAAVGAYYWGTGSGPQWPGVRMTPVAGETDLWSIDIDTDKFQNIIFTRVNGSGTVSDWGAKTADLTVPTDDKNLYTITSTTPVWGNPGVTGTWSVYAPDAPKTYKDITITVVANATPKIHYWEGGDKVIGTEWETKPEMVATGEANTYSYTIKEVDEATGVKYLVVVGEVQSADQQTFENVTANFKDLLPQVALMGVAGWTGDKMTVADDYLSASITLPLEATKDYEIKLTVNGEWFGSNAITITKDNNSALFDTNGDGNGKLTTDLAGDYVFTYTYATKTLVVTYPTPVVDDPVVELPAASVRAWAYDLALAVEGEQYTFSYKATTAAKATLIFTDAEGVELSTKDLGLVEAGANTAVLAANELPAGKKVNWAVKLEAGAIAEFTELTDESKGIYNFYLPQGVAVDNNPESASFGQIYVAAATDGASDGSSDRADTQKRGIFIYDQELNELNPTSNVGILPSNVTLGTTSRQAMKRIVVNPLTNEVAFAHNADPMAVWAVAAENVGGEAKNLIEGLGFTNVNSICFTEDGTLYVLESNGYPAPGSLYKVANGVVDTIFAGNTRFGNGDNALVSDNRGGVWICQNRGQLDTYNQLTHVNAAGEIDFEVNTATPNGFESKNTARGTIAYNPAEDILAMSIGTGSTIGASLFKVTYDETTGVPALTFIAATPSMGKNVDGLAFDYAGDLYGLSANKERLYKYAVPTDNNVCTTPAAAKYAFEVGGAATPVEMVGVVKRALQIGESTVVLTHEANGTPHIYNIVDGEISEVSQEGVIARDPENLGDLLAISDIAATEDGKLVAVNYMICQSDDSYVDEGYKRGENRFYIWNTLTEAPTVWFKSNKYSNWFRAKQGYSIALRGTSQNAEIVLTGLHATKYWARYTCYKVVDGAYTEDYWFEGTLAGTLDENKCGSAYELNASPLNAANWIMDGELADPIEYLDAEANAGKMDFYPELVSLSIDLGKKYNGASYVTVGEQVLMVAPYATAEGLLAGVKVLDITAGLASATEVAVVDLDAAVEATAAATAVEVVEGDEATSLLITLVADATIYSLEATLAKGDNWEVYEDEITNLVIDLDNLVLIGGPSANFQVDVYLGLGDYNRNDDTYQLLPESSIAVMGSDATFIEGYAYEVDAFTPSAKAVVRCEWNGMKLEFHLTMSAAPLEATKVVVENAVVEIEKYLLFGDMYDYALKMSGEWVNPEDGLTYPVLVEVPVYYPEATEPSEIMSTVTVGGWGDNDPWLGFGEGTLTVTTVDGVVTATGIVQNPMAGVAIDITISGKIVETALEDVQVTVKPVKTIKNGQLIITKDGKEYNVQGATVK